MKRPLIDTQRIPDTGEPVFLAEPALRPQRKAMSRKSGPLAQLLRWLSGPQRMRGYA
jgi:hypothetical protein